MVEYISLEMKRRGYNKEEIERILIKDIDGSVRIDEGQRDSIKILAKMRGYINDDSSKLMIGQTFQILQGNGKV
jgi:hypothetical protein